MRREFRRDRGLGVGSRRAVRRPRRARLRRPWPRTRRGPSGSPGWRRGCRPSRPTGAGTPTSPAPPAPSGPGRLWCSTTARCGGAATPFCRAADTRSGRVTSGFSQCDEYPFIADLEEAGLLPFDALSPGGCYTSNRLVPGGALDLAWEGVTVEQAIHCSQPTGPGQRNHRVFAPPPPPSRGC